MDKWLTLNPKVNKLAYADDSIAWSDTEFNETPDYMPMRAGLGKQLTGVQINPKKSG